MGHELHTRTGALEYITEELLPLVRQEYDSHRDFHLGAVFARSDIQEGTELERATPVLVSQDERQQTASVIRTMATRANSEAAILAGAGKFPVRGQTLEARAVVVQLEHRRFGDLAWVAQIEKDGTLGEFAMEPSLEDLAIEIEPTRLLRERWMN